MMMLNGVLRGMAEKLKTVVFDAGPIIHLGEFQEILLAESVCDEINHHRPLALHHSSLSLIRCPQKYPTGKQLCTMCRIFSLDSGEMGALAIMESNPGAVFFTELEKVIHKIENQFQI